MAELQEFFPVLWRLIGPMLSKRFAELAADYLNQRRKKRSAPLSANCDLPLIKPETSQPLCQPAPKPPPRIIIKSSLWHFLSSGLIGVGLTVVVGLILFKRS